MGDVTDVPVVSRFFARVDKLPGKSILLVEDAIEQRLPSERKHFVEKPWAHNQMATYSEREWDGLKPCGVDEHDRFHALGEG